MNEKYRSLFKNLVNSYYNGDFDSKVTEIIETSTINKKELAQIISSLCGVNVNFSSNYIKDLKLAIKNYTPCNKIVSKLDSCSLNCSSDSNEPLCQKACPFNAIFRNNSDNKIYINDELCLDCGLCIDSCPNGGILEKTEFIPLLNLLKNNTPVIAAVAPSIVGQLGDDVTIYQLRSAFKKLGFSDMIEIAFFADMLTLKEAVEYNNLVKNKDDFMITSCCCPMWVGMIRKVYDDLIKHVSPSISPMIASGRVLKKLNPKCKVVFVGPCIAKKAEAKEKDLVGDIDFVLTYTEVKDIFDSLNIHLSQLEEDFSEEYASKGGRLYARTGGVSIAISDAIKRLYPNKFNFLKSIQGNGVKECKEILNKLKAGTLDANFIEGMGCVGGCVGGPKTILNKDKGKKMVDNFAKTSNIEVSIDSDCMKNILNKLNINSIEDFKDKEKISIFERDF